MPRLYRRGRVWWVDMTVRGRRLRRSTDTTDKKEAEGLLRRMIQEAEAPPFLVAARKRAERYKGIQNAGGEMPKTEIYKLGEDISVVTTATDEKDFVRSFTESLGGLVGKLTIPEREVAVRAAFDIYCKLRGYKSDVQERRVLAAGRWPHPSEQPTAAGGDETETEEETDG